MINWHRLFGLTLEDYFTGTGYRVELEKELSRKRQLLDIVIIHADQEAARLEEPCDGLEDLRKHNLMTYKSGRESLTAWAIEELIGHYVSYRKTYAPNVPATHFGLYAVTTRSPRGLQRQLALETIKQRIYTLQVVSQRITVIVLGEVAQVPRNAPWELFSFDAEKIIAGASGYRWRQPDHVPVLQELYHHYRQTGIEMPYTIEDFRKDLAKELLAEMPPEERLRGLPPEERLRGLPPEERLQGLTDEELEQFRKWLEGKHKH